VSKFLKLSKKVRCLKGGGKGGRECFNKNAEDPELRGKKVIERLEERERKERRAKKKTRRGEIDVFGGPLK